MSWSEAAAIRKSRALGVSPIFFLFIAWILAFSSADAGELHEMFIEQLAATRSLEHGHANGFFELTNATAQRRLSHKQGLGSPAKASIFRGNYCVSELLEGDGR